MVTSLMVIRSPSSAYSLEVPMSSVLEDVVVLETAEWVSGPYCGKMLADYGASVVKIEPPRGDSSREVGPFPAGVPDVTRSGLFLHLNTGKKSVILDLTEEGDRARFIQLAKNADVIVDDGFLGGVGINYDELRCINPGVIWVEIS